MFAPFSCPVGHAAVQLRFEADGLGAALARPSEPGIEALVPEEEAVPEAEAAVLGEGLRH